MLYVARHGQPREMLWLGTPGLGKKSGSFRGIVWDLFCFASPIVGGDGRFETCGMLGIDTLCWLAAGFERDND